MDRDVAPRGQVRSRRGRRRWSRSGSGRGCESGSGRAWSFCLRWLAGFSSRRGDRHGSSGRRTSTIGLTPACQVVGWLFCLFNLAGMAGSEVAARLYLERSRRGGLHGRDDGARSSTPDVGGGRRCGPRAGCAGDVRADQLLRRAGPACAAELVQRADRRRVSRHPAFVPDHLRDFRRSRRIARRRQSSRTASAIGVAWQMVGILSMLSVPCYWALRPRSIAPELAAEPAD